MSEMKNPVVVRELTALAFFQMVGDGSYAEKFAKLQEACAELDKRIAAVGVVDQILRYRAEAEKAKLQAEQAREAADKAFTKADSLLMELKRRETAVAAREAAIGAREATAENARRAGEEAMAAATARHATLDAALKQAGAA